MKPPITIADSRSRRFIEAPDADNRLYYFLDLTGPGKPQMEPDDVINPAEKLAYDTFAEVVDSVVLLDRTNIVEFQRQGLYGSMGLVRCCGTRTITA